MVEYISELARTFKANTALTIDPPFKSQTINTRHTTKSFIPTYALNIGKIHNVLKSFSFLNITPDKILKT